MEDDGVSADACIFKSDSDTYNANVTVLKPILTVDKNTVDYNSGDELTFNLKTNDGKPIANVNLALEIFDENGTSYQKCSLTGNSWAVDLPVGNYSVGVKNPFTDEVVFFNVTVVGSANTNANNDASANNTNTNDASANNGNATKEDIKNPDAAKNATPKIIAKNKTFKKSLKVKKYIITLKDNKGKVMKKARLP